MEIFVVFLNENRSTFRYFKHDLNGFKNLLVQQRKKEHFAYDMS